MHPELVGEIVTGLEEAGAVVQREPLGPAPSLGAEWLFHQALAGAWPSDLALEDEAGLQELCDRLVSFTTKALREAKWRTSWTDQNERYEAVVENYVRALFSPRHRALLSDIRAVIATIEPAGTVNSLAQLALKLTLPGVADIYQGCELMDFRSIPTTAGPLILRCDKGYCGRCTQWMLQRHSHNGAKVFPRSGCCSAFCS